MKRMFQQVMGLFLACVMLFLCACQGELQDPDTTTDGGTTTAPSTETEAPSVSEDSQDPSNALLIAADGESRYTIIRSDLDTAEAKLAVTLRSAIQEATGIRMALTTDYSAKDMTDYEIVIGKTTRENALEGFVTPSRYKDWTITQIENRIYIRGGSYEGTKAALDYFIANYIRKTEKAVMVPQNVNLSVVGDYTIGNLTMNGNSLDLYKIVIPRNANASVQYAAEELQAYVSSATGYTLEIVKDNVAKSDYELRVGVTNRGVGQVDISDLGDEGFVVASVGDSLILTGGEKSLYGHLYAVYEFLRSCLGYGFYASDCEHLPSAESLDVSDVNLRWLPTFDYRQVLWGEVIFNLDLSAKLQVSGDWGIGNQHAIYPLRDQYIGNSAHTFAELMDVPEPGQPCLCDESNYEKALSRVMERLANNSTGKVISISQNDNHNYCTCNQCKAKEAQLGTKADILLSFVNRIAEEVAKKYPDVKIHTFAYYFTIEPPKTVTPADNVIIEFAPLGCCWYCSLDDPSCETNAKYWEYFQGWSEITENIQIWDYTTNFGSYLLPFTNFDVMRENVALYAEHGVDDVFSQGQQNGGKAGFGVLSSYLVARLLAHPTMSEEEYDAEIVAFMKAYYGDAWEPIYTYFNLVHELNEGYHSDGYGNTGAYYERLAEIDALWSSARNAVKNDALLLQHVELAELQHTYVKLSLTWTQRYALGDSASKAAYEAENEAFYRILEKYNITLSESTPLSAANVDYRKPPVNWH